MKKIKCVVLSLSLIFLQTNVFAELTLQDLRLPKDFYPVQSPYATVNTVREDPQAPGFLIFSVSSPQGEYTVHGLSNFRKCLREIDVIEELNRKSTGSGVADGAVGSIKQTGTGLKNLLFHPVDSVKGIGQATGKIGTKVAGAFDGDEAAEAGKGDGFLSSTKRKVAKELGVDVYSRNPALQEKLDKIAKARLGGQGAVMVAQFLLPVGLLASAVLTVSGVNSAADQMVNDNDRSDLYRFNEKALLDLGFSKEKVTQFLNHPYYTPREITYLRFYLEKLKGVKGFQAILDAALTATTELPAEKILYEAQIAADALNVISDARQIIIVPEGFILETPEKIILTTPYDYLTQSPLSDRLVQRTELFKKTLGKSKAEIWNGGVVTSKLAGALLLKGIKVQRMCLFQSATQQPTV